VNDPATGLQTNSVGAAAIMELPVIVPAHAMAKSRRAIPMVARTRSKRLLWMENGIIAMMRVMTPSSTAVLRGCPKPVARCVAIAIMG